jgi:branched-chain amino acid transport system substrate-binding protein
MRAFANVLPNATREPSDDGARGRLFGGTSLPEGSRSAKSDDGTGHRQVKEMPTDDPLFGNGSGPDGRKDSSGIRRSAKSQPSPGRLITTRRATIPADQAFRPLAGASRPLVKK